MKPDMRQYLKKTKNELLVLIVFVVYVSAVILAYPRVDNLIFMASALPGLVVAAFLGLKMAIITYVFCLLLNLILHQFMTTQNLYSGENFVGLGIALIVTLLVGRLTDQKRKIQELQTDIAHLNRIDPLTNLLNRGTLLEFARQEFKQTTRSHFASPQVEAEKASLGTFSVAIIEMDVLKEVNEQYGQVAGDDVLRTMGEVLSSFGILRESDLKGRYGGKEFLLILPNTSSKAAVVPLKKLSKEIKSIQFVSEADQNFTVSFSCGVSQYEENDQDIEDILKRAEKALSTAKKTGDRIGIYEIMGR